MEWTWQNLSRMDINQGGLKSEVHRLQTPEKEQMQTTPPRCYQQLQPDDLATMVHRYFEGLQADVP
jgi:hypothetical protein